MEARDLIWKQESRREVYKTPVFSIQESCSRSPLGEAGRFTVIDALDWAVVIPVLGTEQCRRFVMVRQWRHGSQSLSVEFPGGVFERGEEGEQAAARELWEETGYTPGRIQKLGEMSPNPAIMSNRVHFFLAEDLRNTGSRALDQDEFVDTALIAAEEVIKNMGKPPYIHALMASALALYSGFMLAKSSASR
jgi:8-oxo-dGTP pyrophosphatase MutT (NUDIX family)